MKTAQYIKDMIGWTGNASMYKLSEPMFAHNGTPHSFVIMSACYTGHLSALASHPNSPNSETFIFPAADADTNEASSWCEMPGSRRGTLDHAEVLNDLGYTVLP